MRTNRGQSKVQQEGVEGGSSGQGSAKGSLDCPNLHLYEAIQGSVRKK